MHLERVSLRTLIVVSLLVLAAMGVIHTIAAKLAFREAAVRYRIDSLSRVIEVAALEATRQMRGKAIDLGHSLQADITADLAHPGDGAEAAIEVLLDDPFLKGFTGAGELHLVKLRVYDAELRPVAQSSLGLPGLAPHLPAFLEAQARGRTGVDRYKALGGLWRSSQDPLYSVLVPIGGLRGRGYLEAVVDPTFNLSKVGAMIQMPFRILAVDGTPLGQNGDDATDIPPGHVPVEHRVRTATGEPALRLVAYENPETFYSDMHERQLRITVAFLTTMGIGLVLLLWLLNRLLFRPMDVMVARMENCTGSNIDVTLDEGGIKEIHRATRAFNTLASRVRDSLRVLQQLSAVDGLTGIANRRHFDAQLEREWQRALRNGTPLALVLMDIDYFKEYNDRNGHPAGDQCLKQVAGILRDVTRAPTDLMARYGGEEFVSLLPETDEAGAGAVAQRVMEQVENLQIRHPASQVADHITLSIGICSMRVEAGMDSAPLVAAADAALYRAKRRGRNRIEFARDTDIVPGKRSGVG